MIPLLLEVVAVLVAVLGDVRRAVVIAAAAVIGIPVEHGIAEHGAFGRVLRDGYADHLVFAVFVGIDLRLRAEIDPREAALLLLGIRPLAGTQREEVRDQGGHALRRTDDQRLAVHQVPRVRIFVQRIDALIDLDHPGDGIGIGIKRDLRRVPAHLPVLVQDLHQLERLGDIRPVVRGVKDQKVDPGIGQHLHVAAQHPSVVRFIEAVQRIAPIIGDAAEPRALRHGCHGVRVLRQNVREAVRPGVAVMPKAIEHRDLTAALLGRGGRRHDAAEVVRRRDQRIAGIAIPVDLHIVIRARAQPYAAGRAGVYPARPVGDRRFPCPARRRGKRDDRR